MSGTNSNLHLHSLTLRADELPAWTGSLDAVTFAGPAGRVHAGPGLALATRGSAGSLALPAGLADPEALDGVLEVLEAAQVQDPLERLGSGPLVCAALPFDRRAPARIELPSLILGIVPGSEERWCTLVTTEGTPSADDLHRELDRHRSSIEAERARTTAPPVETGSALRPSPEAFMEAVSEVVARIRGGALEKVVLTRRVDLEFAAPVDTQAVLRRLTAREPGSMVFAHPVEGGRFLGATPELIVERTGSTVVCHPLAGTIAQDARHLASATLFASAKDRAEHDLVVTAVAERLAPFCSGLAAPDEPAPIAFGSIVHLGTRIEGRLRAAPGPLPGSLRLVGALHPTPAVGGTPVETALEVLAQVEGLPRGPWAGPVGWMDARGDGAWHIGIRSALVDGAHATLWAGVGIVADSVPAAELDETELKFTVMHEALAASGSLSA
jgi:menaquinone-specific isochorismate synthase